MATPAWISGDRAQSLGLLFLRLGAGGFLLFGHGLPKLLHFGEKAAKFADPLHIGPTLSFTLATGAEVLGSLLVIAGVLTRPAAASVLFTMLVAGLLRHGPDPWARKELALLYAVAFATLALTGPGPYALGGWIRRRFGRSFARRRAGGEAVPVPPSAQAPLAERASTADVQP